MTGECSRNHLKLQSPRVFEASLIITLILITGLFIASKEFVVQTREIEMNEVILKVEDIPITQQIRRPPPPPKPSIPVASEEPVIADDLTLPDLTWTWDDPPPPPPPDYDPDIVHVVVEHPPQLIGGEAALMKYIVEHDLFPTMALQAGVGGFCMIQFTVDTTGIPFDISIRKENPQGLGFGEAGMKAVAAMKFTPGIQHDRLVRVKMKQAIGFHVK
jgi:protein TonB